MKKYHIVTTLFLLLANSMLAQSVHQLTLQETIRLATESSLQSFRIKNLYLSSFWGFRAFKAGRLPSLTLNMTPLQFNRDFTKRYDPDNNIDVYRAQQSLSSMANLSINQNLDLTGGTFFIDTEIGFLRTIGETTLTQYSSVPLRIGYYQSLVGFNKFKWEKKIEPLKYEKAKRQFLYLAEETSETAIKLFFDLAMAQSEHEQAKENLQSTDTLYKLGKERFKIASISQADLYTLKLDAINAKNSLRQTDINVKRAMSSLCSFLNMGENQDLTIILPYRPKDIKISLDKALQFINENNPDLLENQQTIMEADMELEFRKRENAFNATVSVSVGFNQVAGTFSGAYQSPRQQNIVSIGLTVPILDWGVRKGQVNMATNSFKVAQISSQQKKLTLEQEIIVNVNEFNMQLDFISSAEEALQLAVSAFNATKQRFIIGKSDLNSLTLSLNRQKDAQKNYILALNNYWTTLYKIRKLTLYDFENQQTLSYLFDKMNNIE